MKNTKHKGCCGRSWESSLYDQFGIVIIQPNAPTKLELLFECGSRNFLTQESRDRFKESPTWVVEVDKVPVEVDRVTPADFTPSNCGRIKFNFEVPSSEGAKKRLMPVEKFNALPLPKRAIAAVAEFIAKRLNK